MSRDIVPPCASTSGRSVPAFPVGSRRSPKSGRLPGTGRVRAAGFTLVELIVIIILLGVLSAYIAPRFSLGGLQQAGYTQQALAALRYAQKAAVAGNCSVTFTLNSTSQCSVTKSGCGGAVVNNPASGLANWCNQGQATGVAGGPVTFDSLGRVAADAALTISGQAITVHANTGFVEE
jgi:MSHA pilin protein MshC